MTIPPEIMKLAESIYGRLGRGSFPDTLTVARAIMEDRAAVIAAERARWESARLPSKGENE